MVTVTVTDDGGDGPNDEFKRTFTVSVFDEINTSPTINQVTDQVTENTAGSKILELTGITDSDDGSQALSIEVNASDMS